METLFLQSETKEFDLKNASDDHDDHLCTIHTETCARFGIDPTVTF